MTESDPGAVPQRTAGDVGARRHSVGESVPADEGNSLNVPPTTTPPEASERDRGAAAGPGAERRETREAEERGAGHLVTTPGSPTTSPKGPVTAADGRVSEPGGPSANGTSAAEGAATRVRKAEDARDDTPVKEAAADIAAEAKKRSGLMWAAAGTVAVLIVRRVLRRRAGK